LLRKLTLGGVAAVAAAAAVFLSQVAFAHSRPVRFDPAPGAVLGAAPAKVDGWFTAELRRDPNWTFIHVADAQGNRVDAGEAVLGADRRQITATLRSGLGPGRYIVSWRTWDDEDGEIFGACHTFFVGQEAAEAAVADGHSLDAGEDCENLEVDAQEGTPTVAQVATATAPEVEGGNEGDTGGGGDSGSDVPLWALVAGIVAGVAAGGIGGRLVASRS